MQYHNFHFYGSDTENDTLRSVVASLPDGEVTKEIAIYTTTPHFGIHINPEVRAKCGIVLIQSRLLLVPKSHFNSEYRFLVFTVFHELAHVIGVDDEDEADKKAIEWYGKYIETQRLEVEKFSLEEKKITSELIKARDWIYIGSKSDNNGYLSFRVSKKIAEKFYDSCPTGGLGVSGMLRDLIELYHSR